MASDDCSAFFSASEDVPILHYYGVEVLTMAKKISIAALGKKFSKMDIEEFLKDTYKSNKQLVLTPYYGGLAKTLYDLSFEELEELVFFKPSGETSSIIGDHNRNEYNSVRMDYIQASANEKPSCLVLLKEFVLAASLENLAANINKGFASYYNPVDQQQLLLLDNRKIYTMDKTKIRTLELKINKEEAARKKSQDRAALPPTSELSDHQELPSKRQRKQVDYAEESGDSSSSVEYPVIGAHTDDEDEDGNLTPILPDQTQQDTQPILPANSSANSPLQFMTAPHLQLL